MGFTPGGGAHQLQTSNFLIEIQDFYMGLDILFESRKKELQRVRLDPRSTARFEKRSPRNLTIFGGVMRMVLPIKS